MADLGPTYFECDCHSHMLVGNVASIDEAADGWKWIELAMWQQGSHRHPWGYRLRHIWHIIWRGTPYLDFTSFDAETARKLRDWLTEAAAQVEGTEVRGDAANMTVALASEVERLRGVVEAALRVRRSPDAFSGRSHWRRHYIEGVEAPVEHTLYRDCGLCTVLNRAALEEG